MIFLCFFNDFFMIFLWFVYDFFMLFLCFFYAVLRTSVFDMEVVSHGWSDHVTCFEMESGQPTCLQSTKSEK